MSNPKLEDNQQPVGNEAVVYSDTLVVDKRRVGNTDVLFALGGHLVEDMKGVANALRSCDIIAIEAPGYKDQANALTEQQAYNFVMSSASDTAAVGLLYELTREQDDPKMELAYALRGTDKQLVFIDMYQDHPEYSKVKAAEDSMTRLAQSVIDVDRVDQSAELAITCARTKAIAWPAREHLAAYQIVDLVRQTSNLGLKLGVFMGLNHYRVAREIGEPTDPKLSSQIGLLARKKAGDSLLEGVREGYKSLNDLARDSVLEIHLSCVAGGRLATHFIRLMDRETIDQALEKIDEIARSHSDPTERRKLVNNCLVALINNVVATELHKIEAATNA